MCGEPLPEIPRTLGTIPIGLHRDSHGKHCPASGKNLVNYRWQDLMRAIFGSDVRIKHE